MFPVSGILALISHIIKKDRLSTRDFGATFMVVPYSLLMCPSTVWYRYLRRPYAK